MSYEEEIRKAHELLEEYISRNSRDCEVLRRLCSDMNDQGRDLRLLFATVVQSGMYWTSKRLNLECWAATRPSYRCDEGNLEMIKRFLRAYYPEEVQKAMEESES